MVAWDFRRLQQHLDRYQPGSLVLLVGEEAYLVGEAIKLIESRVLKEGAVDFNYDQFIYPESSPVHVKDVVETLPVMCEQRLIVYKGIHDLKDKDWSVLLPLFENPIDSSCFVLSGEKIDKRKKYFKKISEKGTVVELKRPYDNQIPAWIDYISYQEGLKFGRDAIALFHQVVGSSLTEIHNEIVKLKQYMGERTEVQEDDILKVISKSRVDSIFDLTNAIGRNDRVSALVHLANLLDHGQSEVAAVSMILRHIRILAALKEGVRDGLSGARLSAKAGVPPTFLQDYLGQCRHWKEEKIRRTIDALHKTDKALKSSPVSSHIWLENFVIHSCG